MFRFKCFKLKVSAGIVSKIHTFFFLSFPHLVPLRNNNSAVRPGNLNHPTYAIKVNIKCHHKHKPYSPSLAKILATSLCLKLSKHSLMPRHLVRIAYGTQLIIPGCGALVAVFHTTSWSCWRRGLTLSLRAITLQSSNTLPVVHVIG